MSEQAEEQQQAKQTQDVVQLWRDWLTQSERQFNSFFSDLMESEAFARSATGSMEAFITFQRLLADGMERYLAMMNMPSRTDIIALGEALRSIEGRLANMEEMFRIATELESPSAVGEPARTRQPAGAVPPAAATPATERAIPEELRR